MDLFVFHRNRSLDLASIEGGAKGIVIDLETRGKAHRQKGFDTQINEHGWQDIAEVKQDKKTYVICRLNGINEQTALEVNRALDLGVDELLIPMVRKMSEVSDVLKLAENRAHVSVMIETLEAIEISRQLDQLPLARVYVGLNDLSICRQSHSIFSALADGTVESIRGKFRKIPFGFGGLTIPGYGSPLPVEHFLGEMTRLECAFTFLRRSFFRDTANRNLKDELPIISSAVRSSVDRDTHAIKQGQLDLAVQLQSILMRADG